MPAIPCPLSERRRDDPGDERAVPLAVGDVAADEALRERDAARELGVVEVEARVDHGDAHRRQRRAATSGQKSNAWICVRYHCFAASGSFGTKPRAPAAPAGSASARRGEQRTTSRLITADDHT